MITDLRTQLDMRHEAVVKLSYLLELFRPIILIFYFDHFTIYQ